MSKMYEYVGGHDASSHENADWRQEQPQRRYFEDHIAWRNKNKDYYTTTHEAHGNEDKRPTHSEQHLNDHPLGGDC